MAFKMSIREASAFRAKCGQQFTATIQRFQTKVCPNHKRQMAACADCGVQACEEHAFEVETCGRCVGPQLSPEEWLALDWVIRKRTDPDATYDENEDLIEVMERVGESFAGMPEETNSTPSSNGTSPLSSAPTDSVSASLSP